MKKSPALFALSVVGVLALAGCSGGGNESGGSPSGGAEPSDIVLTWETTGGPATEKEKEALQDPYTEETGVRFENVSSPTAVNQIQTMVDTGNVIWDITHKGSFVSQQHCGVLFEEVDYPEIPDELFPEGSTNACAKPLSKYGAGFAYDPTAYPDEQPTEIEDFFDVDTFPGQRVVYGANPRGVLEAALVADGVDPEELFPLDIDRAIGKLDTIKEHIIFAPTLTALQQNIVDKQATMTITLTGRLSAIVDSGGSLEPVWDFTSWDFDALLIPKGSKNVEAARDAIAFALEPEQVVRYAELSGSTPVRTDVELDTVEFTESQAQFNPFLNEGEGTLTLQDPEWWAEHNDEANEAYVAWQVG
jgi:putative spermidine/putrescine transport system substrate-binding protein